VKKIKNIEKFCNTPWIHKLHFFVKENDVVEATTNHTQRAGLVITVGDTRDEAVLRAETVINGIEIEMV